MRAVVAVSESRLTDRCYQGVTQWSNTDETLARPVVPPENADAARTSPLSCGGVRAAFDPAITDR
ncbi:hypothetical protein GCM10017674_22230 [Streptomyces gardneri]|uniref:Uncharacterized protein n=1 Tax=Streptomyces gardneri TaxID=66892 RepID=A0A4Y3RIY3_9ACTN|nr:hypothetical protein SGA01_22320 [Streptomyces gardneri]GHG92646.1 hypothetical protein GCM10017674_22230 [Streptomyces gardneri]